MARQHNKNKTIEMTIYPPNKQIRDEPHIHRLITKNTQNNYWWNLYDQKPNPTMTTHMSSIDKLT